MNAKLISIILCLMPWCCTTSSLIIKSDNFNFIDNDKISYTIVIRSEQGGLIDMYVRTNLSDKQLEIVHKLNSNDWLFLLANQKRNWAANLILYEIFDKDATILYTFKDNAQTWLGYQQKEDITYWRDFLSQLERK